MGCVGRLGLDFHLQMILSLIFTPSNDSMPECGLFG